MRFPGDRGMPAFPDAINFLPVRLVLLLGDSMDSENLVTIVKLR